MDGTESLRDDFFEKYPHLRKSIFPDRYQDPEELCWVCGWTAYNQVIASYRVSEFVILEAT